ncbi:MAG TPA: hypothetical protein PKV86_10740 [Syntrophobacteraceae bacterium]|nr:hypothetical protein [Syntrophobacteraceae bacterium]
MGNPFYAKQEWPNWQPLSLDSVPWCLIAAQFHTQTVRAQKVVEYSIVDRRTSQKNQASGTPSDGTKNQASASPSGSTNNKQDFPRGAAWSWTSKEAATRALQESLLEAQLRLELELAPSRMLVPEISITHAPEWKPLALPASYSVAQDPKAKEDSDSVTQDPKAKEDSDSVTQDPKAKEDSDSVTQNPKPKVDGGTSFPSAFTFLILAHPHQVPIFCSQSASGLVCLRAFSVLHPGPYPHLYPVDAGILTLIRPLIHISGLLPLTGPPLFPLQVEGPVAKHMNEAFETSKQRCPSGVLWSLVDTQPQHPIATGL